MFDKSWKTPVFCRFYRAFAQIVSPAPRPPPRLMEALAFAAEFAQLDVGYTTMDVRHSNVPDLVK